MDNCIRIRCYSPFHYRFIFVDTQECISARLFAEAGIRITHIKEMIKQGSPFRLVICSVRRKDIDKFGDVLETLKNNVMILGYRDYDSVCEMLRKAAG